MNTDQEGDKRNSMTETADFSAQDGWLRGLVEQTLAGIYLIQDGHFRYVNQGFADIFGYASPAEIIDKPSVGELIAPEDRQKVADNIRRRADGEVTELRYTFVGLRRDGRRIHVEVHGRSMEFKGRPAVIGLLLDVTERKLAETASDEKLRALYELSPLGIALVDAQGHHVEFNDTFLQLLGYPAEVLQTLDFHSLIPERFADEVARLQTSLETTGRYGLIEMEYRNQNGRLIPVQVCGMRITGSDGQRYLWSIVEDISTRKQAEQALQDSLRFARQLIEAIPSPVFCKDRDGRYLGCNEAFERYIGKPRHEFIGKSVYDLSPKELADRYFAADKALFDEPGTQIYETVTEWADGTRHSVIVHKATFTRADGQIGGLVGVILDITERKRLESEMAAHIEQLSSLNRQLEEAQTQLLQAEKMSAVGQLAAGVAHEINNPVGFVNSNLGTLREYLTDLLQLIDAYENVIAACPPDHPAVRQACELKNRIDFQFISEDAPKLLQESRDGLDRVKRIVADLKDFSRVGESDWQTTDVHQCLDSTLNVVASELKYKATIIKAYGELPDIRCMSFQLNQVFMNLLVNAAHAIQDKGTITLRTGRTDDAVWIEVEDTGEGIPPENLKRIFEPFFTTKPIGKGTGLGLSVSYGIIQKHHGHIEAHSIPGKGSTFRIVLPIDPRQTSENETAL
ncbi:MAG: PAS domain S-box protein [Formivibrio sp.]|nr:PAS domain S-box protein [Formivibrio sp.]